jgi:hypothetical protein
MAHSEKSEVINMAFDMTALKGQEVKETGIDELDNAMKQERQDQIDEIQDNISKKLGDYEKTPTKEETEVTEDNIQDITKIVVEKAAEKDRKRGYTRRENNYNRKSCRNSYRNRYR